MTLLVLALLSFALAAVPAVLFFANLRQFRPPADLRPAGDVPAVSVLIPARDEERSIVACVESVLADRGVDLEVIVLDDYSSDATAERVRAVARRDPRVRLETAPPLPAGWCGKQHACYALSRLARHDLLVFIDADVRLGEDALSRAVGFLRSTGAALVSGFPRQETGSVPEKLLIPLIHFVLLGFLPVARMRASAHPAYGAGCGQFFLARRDAYETVGGHAAVRESLHDGIRLPRAFRGAGLRTDIFDATGVAACRMYRGGRETWRGLAKNATEGMASPAAIVPWTAVLLGGQVLPPVLLVWVAVAAVVGAAAPGGYAPVAGLLAGCATVLGYAVRVASAVRFRQPMLGAALHPAGILLLVLIQWDALVRRLAGVPRAWKGRAYPAAAARVPREVGA